MVLLQRVHDDRDRTVVDKALGALAAAVREGHCFSIMSAYSAKRSNTASACCGPRAWILTCSRNKHARALASPTVMKS